MSKSEKAISQKYMQILEKFGLLPNFEFTKKEKKVVKLLAQNGDMDLLSIGDALDMKPEKVTKVAAHLVEKGAASLENDLLRLSPLCLRYLHAKKNIRKSAKKFYRFIDALSEKEMDEFMKLVYSFEVVPPQEAVEAPKEEKVAEQPKPEPEKKPAPRKAPVRKAPAPKAEAPKPAPARKSPARKKPAPKQEPKVEQPQEEKKEEAANE